MSDTYRDVFRFESDAQSFRKLGNPLPNHAPERETYHFYMRTSGIARSMMDFVSEKVSDADDISASEMLAISLKSDDQLFHLKNRGILIVADKVKYDNRTGKGSIYMNMQAGQGIVDGLTTLRTIIECNEDADEPLNQFVNIEVITGEVAHLDIPELRYQRNLR